MAINAALGPSELHEKSVDAHTLHQGTAFCWTKEFPQGHIQQRQEGTLNVNCPPRSTSSTDSVSWVDKMSSTSKRPC